jgi:hypothetical protein
MAGQLSRNTDPNIVSSVTIPASLRALALEVAAANGLTLSGLVRAALREHATKRGYRVPAHQDAA